MPDFGTSEDDWDGDGGANLTANFGDGGKMKVVVEWRRQLMRMTEKKLVVMLMIS